MSCPSVEISHIGKHFGRAAPIFRDVCLTIEPGEMVALIGASGSGKSTLIRTIAGLTPIDATPADSAIRIFGNAMQQRGRVTGEAGALRARVGVIFQQFNLVSRLSVLTNVMFGLLGQVPRWRGSLGFFTREEKLLAMRALQRVGIAEHALKRGSELSGGQQQRAAIARTLLQGADVLLADEPIASLDPSSARRVMDIISDLNGREKITVVISLHQVEYALRYCPRTVALRNGGIAYDGPSEKLTPAFLAELYGTESDELFLPGLNETSSAAHTAAVDAVSLWDKHAMNGGAVRAREDHSVAGHA